MLIRFDHINEITIPNLNGGEGTVSAKMFMDTQNKVMMSRNSSRTVHWLASTYCQQRDKLCTEWCREGRL